MNVEQGANIIRVILGHRNDRGKSVPELIDNLCEENNRLLEENERVRKANLHSMDVFEDMRKAKDAAEARIAELEAREDAMCDLSYANGVMQGYCWGQSGDEVALAQCITSRSPAGVAELKRLRQQVGRMLKVKGSNDG